jgi:Mlc titration factor MtfA (ptsG expression regulator)
MTSAIIIVLLVIVAVYFVFRKKGKITPAVIDLEPTEYKKLLTEHVAFYQKLNYTDQDRFEQLIADFLAETNIEGIGTDITPLDRTLIASSAVIPIFGFPEWKYKNLTNIILYPDTFDKDFQFEGENRNIMGMVGSGYMNGQMLLSRAALIKGFSQNSGKENAAIHEFVHLLDKADGTTDGIPETFIPHEYAEPWLKMMHQEMHRISEGHSDINPYALTNEAEFLAVASEYFFEKPTELQHKHPELYAELSRIFGQDLAV